MPGRVADDILHGLEQALAFAKGELDPSEYRVHIPAEIDTKAMRERLGMTAAEFAATFRFELAVLQEWEAGRRMPDGTARAYLKVIAQAPETVRQALRAA